MANGINPWPVDFNPEQTPAAPYKPPPMTPYNIPQIDPGEYAITPGAYGPNQLGGTAPPRPTTMPQSTEPGPGTPTAMGPRTPEGTWNLMYKIAQAESGMRNVPTSILDPHTGQPASTASGYWQIIDSTWKEGQEYAGIPEDQRTSRAMDADYDTQKKVAYALYQKRGTTPWVSSQHVWGSDKYANLDVPAEDAYNPSLGQVAKLANKTEAAGQTNALRDAPAEGTQTGPSAEDQAAQQKQLSNLMAMAMLRGWHLQPVAYNPATVFDVNKTYQVGSSYIGGLPHLMESTALPQTRGYTALAPRIVPGRLGQKGPTEPGGE